MPISAQEVVPPQGIAAAVGEAPSASEPLVRIVPGAVANIWTAPQYWKAGIAGATEACWVREGVLAKMVRAAADLAADGLGLIVWDAWRAVAVQQALYDEYAAHLREEHPRLGQAELEALIQEFVARPSRDPLRPAPHLTGGAIDVTLCDQSGNPLPMGTDYDDFTPRAYTRYFEELEQEMPLTPDETAARDNRRRLYHAMCGAGFTNYDAEWWHYDFGNRLWAQRTGQPPVYGPVEPI